MHSLGDMVQRMVHIELRNVPENVHRTLKARAAKAGVSLSAYLLRDLVELAERPTMEEMIERTRSRQRVELGVSVAEIIREEREARGRHLGGS